MYEVFWGCLFWFLHAWLPFLSFEVAVGQRNWAFHTAPFLPFLFTSARTFSSFLYGSCLPVGKNASTVLSWSEFCALALSISSDSLCNVLGFSEVALVMFVSVVVALSVYVKTNHFISQSSYFNNKDTQSLEIMENLEATLTSDVLSKFCILRWSLQDCLAVASVCLFSSVLSQFSLSLFSMC